ncbi:hypothetical protein KIW84_057154 [Lathyrus oleraceus]|nr:hypothetical protein KIW84_057154 [Pisum sativum]
MEDGDDRLPQLPLGSSFLNQLHIKEEPFETETSFKKRKLLGGDAAMNNSSTFPVPLPLDSSPNLTPKKRKEGPSLTTSSETPTKMRRGRPPGSGSKNRKEGPSPTTSETTSAETPTKKRRPGRPPGYRSKNRKEGPSWTISETTSAETPTKRRRPKFDSHIIELNAGQDVIEVLYNMSVANPSKTVTILSASGPVSDIVDLTPNGPTHSKGKFEIYFMAIKCVADDDGRHCREKATFMVGCKDEKGNLFVNNFVNSLIAAGDVKITATLFNTDAAKKAGARISAIEANIDPATEYCRKVVKEEGSASGFLPTTPPSVADGNMITLTSATTSASNDQDMESPSVGNNCQDMKSPSV